LAAVQAQDFAGAKWAVGMRLKGVNDAEVERAFDEGAILRTHVLRPTWHFVTPQDIRGLLALTGPRVHLLNATMYRRLGLEKADFERAHKAITRRCRADAVSDAFGELAGFSRELGSKRSPANVLPM
jgi:hypothetical protein